MRIATTSVFVNDQESALMFYTNVLGIQVKHIADRVWRSGSGKWR